MVNGCIKTKLRSFYDEKKTNLIIPFLVHFDNKGSVIACDVSESKTLHILYLIIFETKQCTRKSLFKYMRYAQVQITLRTVKPARFPFFDIFYNQNLFVCLWADIEGPYQSE